MEIIVTANYEEMSARAAARIIDYVNRKPHALVCFAAGSTPLGTFARLAEASRAGEVRLDECRFVSLDEWVGLGRDVPGSCRQTLDEHLFKPLAIAEERIHFFDGADPDTQGQCAAMDRFIEECGGIDLFLLGVGMNGHLGFNEPGVSFELHSHVIDLDPVTKAVSAKYFGGPRPVAQGITLGIRHMMEADVVIMIADGAKKADIMRAALESEVTAQVPASALQRHAGAVCMMDEAAASKCAIN